MFGKQRIFGIAARGLLLLAAAVLSAASTPGRAQDGTVLTIPAEQWQVHPGDDPRCIAGTDPGCNWQPRIANDSVDTGTTHWLRYQVTLPEQLRNTPQLGLLVQDHPVFYEVYANGHPIGGTIGDGRLSANADNRRILTFPSSYAPDGWLVLVLRAYPSGSLIGGYGPDLPYVLAPADRIRTIMDADTLAYLRFNATHYLCFGVIGCAGFVFLLLFSVNTRLREYFWLGSSLAIVALLRVDEISRIVNIGLPLWLSNAIYFLGNTFTALILIEFVFSFLQRPVPRLFRLIQLLGLLEWYVVAGLPLPSFLDTFMRYSTPGAILLASLTELLMLPMCFRSKLPEMRWIGASVLFIVTENSSRMARELGIPSIPQDVIWRGLDIDVRGIAYLLFALVMLVAMTFRLRRIQDRNREIEQEMAAARSVQQILIPEERPSIPGLAVDSAYLPAQQVGGDFFPLLPSGDGGLLLVVGDVSGKGLPAAMLVSVLVGAIHSTAEFTHAPAELLAHLNQRLIGRAKGGGFSTAVAAFIQPNGQVTIANAGHLSPYLDGKELALPNALPLGIVSGTTYESSQFNLSRGSRLTFYSDGVVEAQNEKGELFGFERGQQISTRSAAAIVEAARHFGQSDDITVVTVERLGAGEEPVAGRVESVLAPA